MNQTKEKILRVAPEILSGYPVAFAYLYGSYARECQHQFSDLDVCIYTESIP
jgi:predicted nucleotidyltransferase